MTTISIKDVPEAWADLLRQRAARHHRSLQGELMALLERAVSEPEGALTARETPGPLAFAGARALEAEHRGWPVVRRGTKMPEQLFAEMQAQGAGPVVGQPAAVDIVRAERDSR